MPKRRQILAAGAGLAAPWAARAQEPIILRVHHWVSAVANSHRLHLVPWARKLEGESGGRLRVQVFPAMQLGGAQPQLYDQARDGVVDFAMVQFGATPGRFPRVEAFEVPFVAHPLAAPNARAVQAFAERHMVGTELRDVRLICAWAHDAGALHAARKVERMEDIRGMRLRFSTRLSGEALSALGAAPIGMPVTQVPEAVSTRVLDGAMIPWEIVPAIRLHEMVRFHTEFPGTPTFWTSVFAVVMNRARYDSLPPDLRAVIDANSGPETAVFASAPWDRQSPVAAEAARRRGNTITPLPEDEVARWRRTVQPVTDAWIAASRERGVDGGALLEEARALVAAHAGTA